MSATRLYVEEHLREGASLELDRRRAHQLRHVLRARPGDEVRVFNDVAGEWRARIVRLERQSVTLAVEARLRAPVTETGPVLAFAPIRKNRLDWMVEKAVELGVGRLAPVLTARTVARIEHGARLRAIATEAAEQCGRLVVPEVAAPLKLADWLAEAAPQGPILLADAGGGGIPILAALPAAAIVIGPEGGLTPEETARLRADPRVRTVSLGRHTLRAETAAVAALVAWTLGRPG